VPPCRVSCLPSELTGAGLPAGIGPEVLPDKGFDGTWASEEHQIPERRQVGQSCPIDGSAGVERCVACRFFRGVESLDPVDGKFHGWKVFCIWPQEGRWTWQRPIPDTITAAFEASGE